MLHMEAAGAVGGRGANETAKPKRSGLERPVVLKQTRPSSPPPIFWSMAVTSPSKVGSQPTAVPRWSEPLGAFISGNGRFDRQIQIEFISW